MFENFFYTRPYTIQIYQRSICLSEHKASDISDSNSPQKLVKYKSNLWPAYERVFRPQKWKVCELESWGETQITHPTKWS